MRLIIEDRPIPQDDGVSINVVENTGLKMRFKKPENGQENLL
jgi:hypothetical protein